MLVRSLDLATPSNCRELLKLSPPNQGRNALGGHVNSVGYGKSVRDDTMENLQPSPKGVITHGCSSQTKWRWAQLEKATFQFACESSA